MTRPTYHDALRNSGVLRLLAAFDPRVVGTLPLGIALPDSDIDIICCAPDRSAIATVIWREFAEASGFAMYQWSARGRPLIAGFEAEGWVFEIFAAADPVDQQPGWQHFATEQRLLGLGGRTLQNAVMALRADGTKTEPAFAAVLRLPGDPYRAMSALFGVSDKRLVELIAEAGIELDPVSGSNEGVSMP